MTPEKKQARKDRNRQGKYLKAQTRKANLALLGKLVFEKEVPTGDVSVVSTFDADGTEHRTVTPEVTKVLDFPPAIRTAKDGSILPLKNSSNDIPARIAGYGSTSLLHLSAKQHKQHGAQSKLRPGNKELHGEAIVELHSRSLAVEIDKVLNPPEAEGTPIPVVPENTAPEVA